MRWIWCVGISVFLGCELQGQDLSDRLLAGSEQWLMDTFEEAHPEHFDQTACLYRWEGIPPSPNTQSLEHIPCVQWMKTKALCDLLFPLIQRKLESRNMPTDCAYWALSMSGLDMHSSNDGRGGIWQLTYPVALAHGLDISSHADERFAPDISTDAALDYINELVYRFHDTPNLALLAFVHSVPYVNGLSEADAQTESNALQTQIDGLKQWYEGTPRSSFLLDLIGVLNTHENVVFEEALSYDVLVDALGVDELYLRGGNPVFRTNKIPAEYRAMPFLLPAKAAAKLTLLGDSIYSWEEGLEAQREAKRLAAIEARRPPAGSAVNYTVRSGDVLGKIAQRHGVRVSEIKSWNGLKSDRISIGQKLVLYPSGKAPAQAKPAMQSNSTGTNTTQQGSSPSTPSATSTGTHTAKTATTYTVKSGDSLWLISQKFPGVSADDIMKHNGIDANLRPGQVLQIPMAQ